MIDCINSNKKNSNNNNNNNLHTILINCAQINTKTFRNSLQVQNE